MARLQSSGSSPGLALKVLLRVMNQPLVHGQCVDVTAAAMLESSGQSANDVKAEPLPEPDGALGCVLSFRE